jgi:AcrR family transcriptional regulator
MTNATATAAGPNAAAERPGRARLLGAVIEHFATQGLGDQSLRQIASAVGSSHRMLLYHFGSKDGLLVAVAQAVEARTRAQYEQMAEGVTGPSAVVIRQMWALVTDPAQGNFERLFFALYGRALQGDAGAQPFLAGANDHWIESNVALAAAAGIDEATARAHTRLGVAVIRGLLLDLLATGDRAGADAALEIYARSYAEPF